MYHPTEIRNPVTGERIVFDETVSDDGRLAWNEVKPAHIEPPPVHYHPDTEEHFEVNEGQLLVEIKGKTPSRSRRGNRYSASNTTRDVYRDETGPVQTRSDAPRAVARIPDCAVCRRPRGR